MFIVVEGIDGSGKSTLAKFLAEKIPNSVILKEDVRWLNAMKKFPEIANMLFENFCVERVNYSKYIDKLLNSGYVVISDRYYPSTVCYQLEICENFDCKKLVKIYNKYTSKWKKPDLILIPSVPFEVCLKRVKARGEEVDEVFLRKVKKCYNKFYEIDDKVVYVKSKNEAWRIVKERLK
jgi:dTMP kinase